MIRVKIAAFPELSRWRLIQINPGDGNEKVIAYLSGKFGFTGKLQTRDGAEIDDIEVIREGDELVYLPIEEG